MSGTTTVQSIQNNLLGDSVFLIQDCLQGILDTISALDREQSPGAHFWHDDVSQLTLNISQFVEITTLLSQLMVKNKLPNVPGVKESHIHLLFIMKAMNQAIQKEDSIVLEELIKYELKDNLTQWKINLLPHIKRLLNL